MPSETRNDEIREIQKEYRWFYDLILGAIVLGIGVWIGASKFNEGSGYGVNLFTELLGISGTVLIINQIYERRDREREKGARQREEERQTNELKRRLVDEVASGSNDFARNAIRRLYAEGWLIGDDGLLKGERLAEADLRKANLRNANLRDADLWKANLQEAALWSTAMHGAHLIEAQLQNAIMWGAVLEAADLRAANLQGADLEGADLRGADLSEANLQNAILRRANLEGANLQLANIRGADLGKAVLKNVDFFGSNLQEANLDRADLENAKLRNVDLENANLSGANMNGAKVALSATPVFQRVGGRFGEPGEFQTLNPTSLRGATLPDDVPFPDDPSIRDDLERFTNPVHPDFPKTLEKIEEIHSAWEAIE